MLYATTKDRFRRELDGVHYEIQATDPTEMDLEVLRERAHWNVYALNSFSYQNLLGFTFNELALHALSSAEPILPQKYTSNNINLKADGFKALSYCCKFQFGENLYACDCIDPEQISWI